MLQCISYLSKGPSLCRAIIADIRGTVSSSISEFHINSMSLNEVPVSFHYIPLFLLFKSAPSGKLCWCINMYSCSKGINEDHNHGKESV